MIDAYGELVLIDRLRRNRLEIVRTSVRVRKVCQHGHAWGEIRAGQITFSTPLQLN